MEKIKPTIKVKFTDFWPEFDLASFMIYKLLLESYEVIISDRPDLLFFSVYGNTNFKYTCTKVFFTAENVRPDFRKCDFAFTFDFHINKRNYRLPLYAFYGDVNSLIISDKKTTEILENKNKFCCFIVSNPVSETRNNFFLKLTKARHVDSGGKLFNNIGGLVENKREFIKNYKFVIAFENSSFPGYVTEKIIEPLFENCIPIYWGNPVIEKDFNTKRFINCHDFPSFEDVIKYVLEIDENDDKYIQYLNEPVFNNNRPNESVRKENIVRRLDQIITFMARRSFSTRLVQRTRPLYCITRYHLSKIKKRFPSIKNFNVNY